MLTSLFFFSFCNRIFNSFRHYFDNTQFVYLLLLVNDKLDNLFFRVRISLPTLNPSRSDITSSMNMSSEKQHTSSRAMRIGDQGLLTLITLMNFMKLGQAVKVSTIFKEWNTKKKPRYQAIMSILLSAFDKK